MKNPGLVPLSVLVVVAGVIGVWRLNPIARDGGAHVLPAGDPVAIQASSEWLETRARGMVPVSDVEALTRAVCVDKRLNAFGSVGLSRDSAEAAVEHAAQAVWHRFMAKQFDGYTAWREAHGYRFFPADRLRRDRVMSDAIAAGAGRGLGAEEADTRELWGLYWKNVIAPTDHVVSIDGSADGVMFFAWQNRSSLSRPGLVPARRAVSSPLQTKEGGPADVHLWRGAGVGQGWPVWFPPDDVEARLNAPGVMIVEVAWVFGSKGGEVQPFAIDLGRDPKTGRWWIMQFYVPHVDRGVRLNTGGL